MIVISATGGSGSSYVVKMFKKKYRWNVCIRPDGGSQKANKTVLSVWMERTKPFFPPPVGVEAFNQRQLFEAVYNGLKQHNTDKTMVMFMVWGGMGFLNDLAEKTIFLIRNPIFAFNSYSGGGWRAEGGQRRIKFVGAGGPNDRKWIDAFLGDFSFWLDGAKNALRAVREGKGRIVRYHRFKEDWEKIDNVPPVYKGFKCRDDMAKVERHLTCETIRYIEERTRDVWEQIEAL